MTSTAQLRKTALAQEGAVQQDGGQHDGGQHDGGQYDGSQQDGAQGRAWLVAGTQFAAALPDGRATLALAEESARRMASELDGVHVTDHGVLVDLAAINGMALNYWVHQAWRHSAGVDLTGAADEAARAAATEDDDFGPIGASARRALHGAGISTVDALAERPRGDVAALHGVGPKAIGLLAQALAERGRQW